MKLPWIQNTPNIKLTQGYHGWKWQNGKALDFDKANLIAPSDGEIRRVSGSGYSQVVEFTLFGFKENIYIQAVHGRPAKMGKFKKGDLIGLCNSHHWHIALNVNGQWQSILDYTERDRVIELVGRPWANPYDQWSFYNDLNLAPISQPKPPAPQPPAPQPPAPKPKPQPTPVPRTYVVKPGDSLWGIAQSQLGSGLRWNEIYKLNMGTIQNPDLIFPGQTFKLP